MITPSWGFSSWKRPEDRGGEKFVIMGAGAAYPQSTPLPYKEENFWLGYPEESNAPYALAKKMLLIQAQAYRQQYGFNAIFLLPTNIYGPGDNYNPKLSHVIAALIRKVCEAKRDGKDYVEIWGTGKPTRDFLYVEDAVEGILLATERYDKPEPVNLGSGKEISIRDLIQLICKLADFREEIRWDTSKPDGQMRRCFDTSKAEKEFGFKAKTDLQEGLKKTIQWYMRLSSQEGGDL